MFREAINAGLPGPEVRTREGILVISTSFCILTQGQEEGWRGQRPPSGHIGLDGQNPKVLKSLVSPESLTQAEVEEYPPTTD